MTNDSTTVLLVRHGRTALNAEGRIRGLADPELDTTGIEQAHATANAMHGYRIARVVTSPLQRAVHTGKIIADTCDIRYSADPAFNDRDYGPWTGHIKADVIRQWGSINAAPEVEPSADVLARSLQALNALASNSEGATIAVVTHDAVVRPLLAEIEPSIDPTVATCSWAELVRSSNVWRVVSFDNGPTQGNGPVG